MEDTILLSSQTDNENNFCAQLNQYHMFGRNLQQTFFPWSTSNPSHQVLLDPLAVFLHLITCQQRTLNLKYEVAAPLLFGGMFSDCC